MFGGISEKSRRAGSLIAPTTETNLASNDGTHIWASETSLPELLGGEEDPLSGWEGPFSVKEGISVTGSNDVSAAALAAV